MTAGPRVWLGYDQAGLDAQYDNQRSVPDYAAIMEEWAEASRLARGICAAREMAYGAHARARLDVYAGGAPLVVFFHGGFWRSFDKSGLAFLAPAFRAAGISLVLPNYPLAPEAGMAVIVEHARRAVAFVVARAGELGADPRRIWVAGHSAGAHLAAMASAVAGIAGCCAISGIHDLAPLRHSYLNATLRLSEEDVARCSPLRRPRPAVPVITAVGDAETTEFRRQTEAFAAFAGARHIELAATHHYAAVRGLARPGNPAFAALASAVLG